MKMQIGFISIAVWLAGCQANTDSVEQILSDIHYQAKTEIIALPEPFAFNAESFALTPERVPFLYPVSEPLSVSQDQHNCEVPELNLVVTQLEQYSLKQLVMKGTIGNQNQRWGLIYTPDKKLVSIKAGHYLGVHRGKVIEVTEHWVEVEEFLSDDNGCWHKQNTKLLLTSIN